MNGIKLSIIIPAYNESANIQKGVLDKVFNYLKSIKYSYEVLIVDDGSTDNTVLLIKQQIKDKKNFRLVENPHGGKAVTVITGLLEAEGDIALFADMDQSTPLQEVEKFFPKFDEGYDVVIGSRNGREGAPVIRKLTAWGFAFLRNLILGLPFSDTQCGFKAFRKQVIKVILPSLKERWEKARAKNAAVNAGFDVEALFLAKKNGFKITEVPVNWHHVGSERVQIVKDSVDGLMALLRIKVNDLRKKI